MITAMKRLLPILLSALLLFLPHAAVRTSAALRASAEEAPRYAVAAQTDVWFYASESEESGLFLMPYTYYVRVLREGTLFTAVQYLDDVQPYKTITGFCRTDKLTFVDFVPQRPYLRREITVTYTVQNGETLMGSGAFRTLERTFVYYGTSYSGTQRFYYVYADGVFDYVPAVGEIVYELNDDYLKETSGGGTEGPASEAAGISALQIVVLCLAAAALVVVAVVVLRGKKPAPAVQEFSEF